MDAATIIREILAAERAHAVLRAGMVLLLGLLAARMVQKRLSLRKVKALQDAQVFLIRRVASWAIMALTFAWAMRELGFQITTLLGAAGVLTLAIAFAAQTSVSNLISGLFLMGERPFGVGDMVKIADITGEVLSIDLLSVRLRTFDNLMVRIPNETMLKSNVTTLTAFPIRRLDVQVGVAYKEDLGRVKQILERVATESPVCLEEPKPLFIFLGFGDSSLNMQFSVWAKRENFLELRNEIHLAIKKTFDEEGVEIPFPHRTLYAGSVTDPLPIRMVTTVDERHRAGGRADDDDQATGAD